MAAAPTSRRIFLKQIAASSGAGPLAALALRLGDDLVKYTSKPGRLS